MRGLRKWLSVDSKSFEITMEGEGRSLNGFVTKRKKGSGVMGPVRQRRVTQSPEGH